MPGTLEPAAAGRGVQDAGHEHLVANEIQPCEGEVRHAHGVQRLRARLSFVGWAARKVSAKACRIFQLIWHHHFTAFECFRIRNGARLASCPLHTVSTMMFNSRRYHTPQSFKSSRFFLGALVEVVALRLRRLRQGLVNGLESASQDRQGLEGALESQRLTCLLVVGEGPVDEAARRVMGLPSKQFLEPFSSSDFITATMR